MRKDAQCSETDFLVLEFFCAPFSFTGMVDFVYGRFCDMTYTSQNQPYTKSTIFQKLKIRGSTDSLKHIYVMHACIRDTDAYKTFETKYKFVTSCKFPQKYFIIILYGKKIRPQILRKILYNLFHPFIQKLH